MFAGIDWASQRHDVCVEDDGGEKLASFCVEHSADGLEQLTRRLARHGEPAALPVSIERPDGRLVDRLLEAGHPVVPVSPNAIKAWREAEVVSGAKSDPGDAEVICEYLRLRFHRLRRLEPFSDATRALRAVVRARDDLVEQRVTTRNQLDAALDAYWPAAKQLFDSLTAKISLAFLTDYPTPAAASHLGERRMAQFLTRHGYSGRRTAAELLARLKAAPAGLPAGAEATARVAAVAGYVAVIRTLNQAIKDLETAIAARLGEHPDAAVFTSLPRSGQVNAAQMLAEWGDCRAAYAGPEAIAALAGMCPVTKKSGKHQSVTFRWACNKRLRNAISRFADNSRHSSPWAADIYTRAIARGCDHPHAIRILARAWIRVIYRCWVNRVPYDPALHKGAQNLRAAPQEAA